MFPLNGKTKERKGDTMSIEDIVLAMSDINLAYVGRVNGNHTFVNRDLEKTSFPDWKAVEGYLSFKRQSNLPDILSKRTRRIFAALPHAMLITFGKDEYNGDCTIYYNGLRHTVYLGDIAGLSPDAIDRRFCAAFLSFARVYMGNVALAAQCNMFEVADLLLMNYAAA